MTTPKTTTVSSTDLVRAVDPSPEVIPTYEFTGRTFYEKGKEPPKDPNA